MGGTNRGLIAFEGARTLALARTGSFDAVVQQRPGFDFEPASNARDVVDRDVAFRSFDPAEIGAVDAALTGQCFLAQTALRLVAAHYFSPRRPTAALSESSHRADFDPLRF